MKNLIIFNFFILIFLFSCNRKDATSEIIQQNDGGFVRLSYNINHKLITKEDVSKNDKDEYITNGYYRKYYENGILSDSVFYANGKKQGVEWSYFSNGKKKSTFFYNQGLLDSVGVVYQLNGELAEWQYRLGGKLCGLQYHYDERGKLNLIELYVKENVIAFSIRYENGQVVSMQGVPLYIVTKSKSTTTNKKYSIANFVFQTSRVKAILNISLLSPENVVLRKESIKTFEHEMNNSLYFFEHTFTSEGKYKYIAHIRLFDNSGKFLKDATLTDTISVVK